VECDLLNTRIMATPKILPPRPSVARPDERPTERPPSRAAKAARKPPLPITPIRAELASVDFEAVEEIADPIDVLFEAMEDLFSVETSVEAGAICLASLIRAIPCAGGIVHLYDAESREFVAVFALGPRAEHLVLTRAPESDALISAAFRKHHPIVVDYRGPGAARVVDRHAMLDTTKNVIVCPIVDGSRFLGAIELVDAKSSAGFEIAAEHGIAYVADRYAGFLAEHGVAIDDIVAPPSGFIS
jgi:hypothetical protein